MENPTAIRFGLASGLLTLVIGVAGCGQKNEYAEAPAPKVTVAQALIQEVTDYLNFTGTLVATERVDVPARVSGVLQSMHFEPGSFVKKGDLLFEIDPAEYAADLQAAEAELAGAEAQYERANIEYARADKLYKKKAGAEAELVKWRVEREVASAAILRAQAKLDRAALNLGYTQVTAPISGRVGRNLVDAGNLVGEGEATILTDVTHYDPIFVYFNLNELDLLRVTEMYREKGGGEDADSGEKSPKDLDIPLYLGLANEEGYPHAGAYDFGESSVDPDTGTLQLRGIFDNPAPAPKLLPGLFARVRLPLGTRPAMPLVTERAIGNDQSGTFLLIVNDENTVERRSVKTGQLIDGLLVIEEGLRDNDRVVVKGLQRARPGRVVDPEQTDMADLTTSAMKRAAEEAEAAARTKSQGGAEEQAGQD